MHATNLAGTLFRGTALVILLSVFPLAEAGSDSEASLHPPANSADTYFQIRVVDGQTGRGVPLVQLRTVNNIKYFTDSNGIAAFYEPGLMNREVFFFVESHGYQYRKDGFGFRGTRLTTTPGKSAAIRIRRINIAERLYRLTGQGIYTDSILTGHPVPLEKPLLNGKVMGQDSVFACIYRDRLFWMWGDTGKPSYPLGNFAMSGAFSDLPGRGGLAPERGVDFRYLVDQNGFSRPISPLKEPGMVWLDRLLTVPDTKGRVRMAARFSRLKSLTEVLERGLVVFNDKTESFEPKVRSKKEFLPFPNTGHAFPVQVDGLKYYYFTTPSPVAPRLRVKSHWGSVMDPNCYEVLTALETPSKTGAHLRRVDLGSSSKPYRWIPFGQLHGGGPQGKASVIRALKEEAEDIYLHCIESGEEITPHNGTVNYNEYRKRWVAIFVQVGGKSSHLGEVWYAEADTPAGPWCYAQKILTHKKYSFYNPNHHSFFDREGGRVIFFEGTYSFTFSGSREKATPRYDYNQIMYRLNLEDPRLALPVPVYQVGTETGGHIYLLREELAKQKGWNKVKGVPFYALEPGRAAGNTVSVYAEIKDVDNREIAHLTTNRPSPSAPPVFQALKPAEADSANPRIVNLYEYRHPDSLAPIYSTRRKLDKTGWSRAPEPLCGVWKAPPGPLLLDHTAKPAH